MRPTRRSVHCLNNWANTGFCGRRRWWLLLKSVKSYGKQRLDDVIFFHHRKTVSRPGLFSVFRVAHLTPRRRPWEQGCFPLTVRPFGLQLHALDKSGNDSRLRMLATDMTILAASPPKQIGRASCRERV